MSTEALEWPGRGEAARSAYEAATSPEARALALESVGGANDSQTLELLSVALRDASPAVRVAACEALVRAGGASLASLLIDRLGDRDASVRVAAAWGLGELRLAAAVEPLSRLLSDPESDVRVAAVEALSEMADATAAQSLLQAVRDTDQDVAVAALRGIESRGDRSALPAVLARVDDPSRLVALAAVDAAGALGGAEQTMQRLARYATTDVAVAALRSLHQSGDPEVVRFLASLGVESPDVQVRVAAMEALIATGGSAAIPLLEPRLARPATSTGAEGGLVLEYFATIGPQGWASLSAIAQQSPERADLWHAWLRSGDAAAVRAVTSRSELSADEAINLLRSSPLPEALCSAAEFDLELGEAQQVAWAQWAFDLGAPSCLDLQSVRETWQPQARLWVTLSLMERRAAEAPHFVSMLELESQSQEDLVAFFTLLGAATQPVRFAAAALPTSNDTWVQRELAVVSLQLYLEGVDAQRSVAEARLSEAAVDVGPDTWTALRCASSPNASAPAAVPVGVRDRRAWALRALACGLPQRADIGTLSHDPAVAIAQLSAAPVEGLLDMIGDAAGEAALRAQALLSLRELDAESAAVSAELHLQSRLELLRAAAWSAATLGTDEETLDALRLQVRSERSEVVGAVLAGRWTLAGGSEGEFAALGAELTNEPTERSHDFSVTSVHESRTGQSVYDAVVVVVDRDGVMSLHTTDLNGLAVIRSRDALGVFARPLLLSAMDRL